MGFASSTEQFPVDINKADYELLLRVPGIGVKSAKLIVASRRFSRLGFYELKKIGVVMKKAQYFITCRELPLQMQTVNELFSAAGTQPAAPEAEKRRWMNGNCYSILANELNFANECLPLR